MAAAHAPIDRGEAGSEPEYPAPMLRLVEGGDHDHNALGADDELDEEETATRAAARPVAFGSRDGIGRTIENAAIQDEIDSANTLAIIGIVVGAVGLLTSSSALVLFRRRRA